jgi:hypothetical protein
MALATSVAAIFINQTWLQYLALAVKSAGGSFTSSFYSLHSQDNFCPSS